MTSVINVDKYLPDMPDFPWAKTMLEHLRLLSRYNQWMNKKLYNAAAQLSPEELARDRGAFFGSLLGTLNHIMVADIIWLQRFADHPSRHPALDQIRIHPKPHTLSQILFNDFVELCAERHQLDATIIDWCLEIDVADLSHKLAYRNMKNEPAIKSFGSLMLHFFNHQTHHRGQATILLSQQELDVGVTDLLELIDDESAFQIDQARP